MDTKSKRVILVITDSILVIASLFISLFITFYLDRGQIPAQYSEYSLFFTFAVIKVTTFYFMGLYNRIWRYASVDDLVNIFKSIIASSFIIITYIYFLQGRFPRSVMALDMFITFFLVGFSRLVLRWRYEYLYMRKRPPAETAKTIFIYGAGDAGEMIIREMLKHPELGYKPVGIIDDDRDKKGMKIHNIPVLGDRRALMELACDYSVSEIIIAIPSATGSEMKPIIDACVEAKIGVKTVPGVYELIDENVYLSQIRDVKIEDLLGREQVDLNIHEIKNHIQGKSILITGAGGSIGSQIVREVIKFKPEKIYLVGRGEHSVYLVNNELNLDYPGILHEVIIADIQDRAKIDDIFSKRRIDVVFHAAAYKHVPLMESHADEAVKNNILGTKNVADAAAKYKVSTFVMISTDKAVNPTSVMGATKRVAEMYIQSKAHESSTKFVAVRFGNVLGSRGSVIPLFKKQIEAGGPVTVTHPEITRYFMTIPEAAKLVVQASVMAKGGEIFILDMGNPVKIADLARDLIRLSGFEPDSDIKIKYTGLRPGEKLYEELLTAEEGTMRTVHKKIFIAKKQEINAALLEKEISAIERFARDNNPFQIKKKLIQITGSYKPEILERRKKSRDEKEKIVKLVK